MKILVTEYTLKIMDYYKTTGKFIKHEILKPLKHYHERSLIFSFNEFYLFDLVILYPLTIGQS